MKVLFKMIQTGYIYKNSYNFFLDKMLFQVKQPKSLALLKDKESLSTKEYIIKNLGEKSILNLH